MLETTSKERPILFSAPMVRAILDGNKTQTRRIVKPFGLCVLDLNTGEEVKGLTPVRCPYGAPGDRLWVRETWWHYKSSELEMAAYAEGGTRCLLPDGKTHDEPVKTINGKIWIPSDYSIWKKTPSIHMPRECSRITLEITGVRVERLNDISESDARAEGITDGGCLSCGNPEPCGCQNAKPDARDAFIHLWHSIHAWDGPNGWISNPWVWVMEFKRVTP